ncbi:Plasma membrane sulfite pump involved in sulfite metabolism [Dipsacomyces acuminosporus]|nr:Plasma membrane sulfite pump involved in sulfite metabolism [Dipsacomyces acuminosporus]
MNADPVHSGPLHRLDSPADVIRGFNPAWFTATMGTGITGTLLYSFPYDCPVLRYISMAIALFNVVLFVIFTVLLVGRSLIYRDFFRILLHPHLSMPVGAIPMGLCTVINSLVIMLSPYHPPWLPTFTLVLWCIDVALSVLCCLCIPLVMTTHQRLALEAMTCAWVLPIVPTIVVAASGAVVASIHPAGSTASAIVMISYALWAMGVGIALMTLTIYILRLFVYKTPPKEAIPSTFIPLGPLGQSSYGIQQLGVQAVRLFPATLPAIPYIGEFMHCFGFASGFLLWGLGLWWFAHAIYSVLITRTRSQIPFNLGWWAFIFPIGTFTSSTSSLWAMTGYTFFRVLSGILIAGLVALWLYVLLNTAWHAWSGELFRPISLATAHTRSEDTLHHAKAGSAPFIGTVNQA